MTSIAFAGSGHISAVHGVAAKAVGLTTTAVASRRWAQAVARAEQLGARPVHYEDLPAGADLVLVCTPPARHADDAITALQGGAEVIVEKPLAATLADADRIVTASRQTGGRVGYAENLVHAPVVAEALRRRPGLGPLRHLEAHVSQGRPAWGGFLAEDYGGGVLFDVGPHPIAVVLLLARPARPVAVRATLAGSAEHVVDDHAEVRLTFDTGLEAPVVVSWRPAEGSRWDVQAASERRVLRVELFPHLALEADGEPVAPPGRRWTVPEERFEDLGYCDQLAAFAADVTRGRRPLMDAEFGREVLEIIAAAYASAGDGGRPQALPFAGPRDRTPLALWRG
jgi:myo-inositol 2-dehydrogenase/D-chiro-inositol 1-dehydrogenase